MFYDILDKNRLDILPLLSKLKDDFYLAGGTGLALQIGHRDSKDFDFFTQKEIDTKKLFFQIKEIFSGFPVEAIKEDKNTLSVLINNNIKLSFFTYPYKLIEKLIKEPYLNIASITDIGCMKLSAATGRAINKDYIDLYYILHQIPLNQLLKDCTKKFPDISPTLILKSLIYFEDVKEEDITFKHGKDITMAEVKQFLIQETKKHGG